MRTGPYRFLRHPNYVAVVVEGFALPLVHAAWVTALVFTVANAVLLTRAAAGRERRAGRRRRGPGRAVRCATWWSPGGGPVGLATALYAARAGLDVLVREPRAGAIDKACGEGLMPAAVADLLDLGVRPGRAAVRRHPLRRRTARRRTRRSARAPAAGCGGPRCTRRCAAAVTAAGVPVGARARCSEVEQRADHVLVDGEPARYLVAADGLHSPVRRMLGLDAPARRAARRYGLRAHLPVAPWSDFVEVHWSPRGEAYVTPVAPTGWSASRC